MHLIESIKHYINLMVQETGVGMKCLLMDKETTSIVSMAYSQTEMLDKEVYLFERIDRISSCDSMKYLKCIVFLRPTKENIDLLIQELRNPKFGQYHLYFSNIISNSDIMTLAESDEHESVRDVQEVYCDYIAVSPTLFSVNVTNGSYRGSKWNTLALQRSLDGIVGVLLSLQKYPNIRYQASSEACRKLAEEVNHLINKEHSLFTNCSQNWSSDSPSPLLLIVDRKIDSFTPLLNQWTYQAMLHELLTINNNRINLSHIQGISKDMKEVIVSAEQDDFYAKNMYKNFGEIGVNIKILMEDFQDKTKSQKKVETISDMKDFIEQYPQFKKMSGTVSKHVLLISELSRLVAAHNLMDVSEAEQELACQSEHSKSLKKVRQLLEDNRVQNIDKLRLVMLYALRFENNSNQEIGELKKILKSKGISDEQIKSIQNLLNYAGSKSQNQTQADLLSTVNEVFKKRIIKGLKGIENIYTQHTPVLREIVEDLAKGRLKVNNFPYLTEDRSQGIEKPTEIIVFMVGGTTYEEALHIETLNRSQGIRVILGSTCTHNFTSFLDELGHTSQRITI
ncbi:vacuolar protein sorting-associated protein 45-like [Panonychus citri]|uniref:vacuolar protein sorting-associated protein 45-like n=1 Tax=Panonychus citri TaxID=50023 RepID=UPI0023070115|nr:vacuolar protein sorting-associated protein 45-like [Panonychus citri]